MTLVETLSINNDRFPVVLTPAGISIPKDSEFYNTVQEAINTLQARIDKLPEARGLPVEFRAEILDDDPDSPVCVTGPYIQVTAEVSC